MCRSQISRRWFCSVFHQTLQFLKFIAKFYNIYRVNKYKKNRLETFGGHYDKYDNAQCICSSNYNWRLFQQVSSELYKCWKPGCKKQWGQTNLNGWQQFIEQVAPGRVVVKLFKYKGRENTAWQNHTLRHTIFQISCLSITAYIYLILVLI